MHVLAQSAPLHHAGGLTSWILDPWILPTPFTSSTSPSGDLRMQNAEPHGKLKRRAKMGKSLQGKAADMDSPCRGHAIDSTGWPMARPLQPWAWAY